MDTASDVGGRGRGRGRGRGQGRGTTTPSRPTSATSSSRVTSMTSARAKGAPAKNRGGSTSRGRGRGGRGRGRGSKLNASLHERSVMIDGDDICEQALGQYEIESSAISKAMEEAEDASQLPGFDETAGGIWMYPTNKPVRDYQFRMVETALFHNTLVSLPTGLGKTFIAAVLMYNFHRWFPQSLIIFMAPTRPLVKQQLEACHNIVGIHPSKTLLLTGRTPPKKREDLWKTKSVFFLTPQVMTSDLARGVCPADKVRCIVFDEAHKALGQHAYVQVIAMLSEKNTLFRVLALSATPGSDLAAVHQVFKNLLISRVELRSENSPDVLPYIHTRQIDKVVVPLDNYLKSVHQQVLEAYQTYAGKLLKNNAIRSKDGSPLSQYQLLMARKTFRETHAQKVPNYIMGYIECDFSTAISLSHCLDLLIHHGLRTFYLFLQGIFNKEKGNPAVTSELKRNTGLQEVLNDVQQKLNISANSSLNLSTSKLFTTFSTKAEDTCNTSILDDVHPPEDYIQSHPKMGVLKDIVLSHFKTFTSDTTRIMIFSKYRDSVQEIGLMLNTLGSPVKPMVFIGQANTGTGGGGKGLKQKDQVQVISRFRDGGYNVLVATCVGEEGLDIGEVDLIVCFDAPKSPTRLVQRMGRTGRQRQGRIIFLLTQGKEEKDYSASFSLQSSISKNITDPSKLNPFLYKHSPRMVPRGVDPQCFKMNVMLTSEQTDTQADDDDDDDEDIDDDIHEKDDDYSESPDYNSKKSALPKKKLKTGVKSTSRPGTSGGDYNTLTQCFNNLFKRPVAQNVQSIQSTNPSMGGLEFQAPNENMDDDVLIIDDESGFNEISNNNTDSNILMDIFDVADSSNVCSKPCLNIPKISRPIQWLPEYNDVDPDLVLLSEYDMDCLIEKVDSLKLVMQYKDICPCGNVNNNWSGDSIHVDNKQDTSYGVVRGNDHSPLQSGSVLEPGDLDGGFLLDENDPFFDDNSDDWMLQLVQPQPENEVHPITPLAPPDYENIKIPERYITSITSNAEKSQPTEDEKTLPCQSSEIICKTPPKKTFVFKLKGSHNNTPQNTPPSVCTKVQFPTPEMRFDSTLSTTGGPGDFLYSPAWRKQPLESKQRKGNNYDNEKSQPGITNPVTIYDLSATPKHSEAIPNSSDSNDEPIVIICDDDSSTTSNDEDFKSPVWRSNLLNKSKARCVYDSATTNNDDEFKKPALKQKLSPKQLKKNDEVNQVPPKSQPRSQIDPDLCNDILLFEDDDLVESFPDDDQNYIPELSVTPTKVNIDHRSIKPVTTISNETRVETHKNENYNSLYNTNQIFSPPSPPSIFNRSRRIESEVRSLKNANLSASKSLLLSPKVIKAPLERTTHSLSKSFNTESDDEIMELDLTAIEQSARSSSSISHGQVDEGRLTSSNLPKNNKFCFKSRFHTSEELNRVETARAVSIYSTTKGDDWIDMKTLQSKQKSQTFKKPLPPQRPPPSKMLEFSDDEDFIIPGRDTNISKNKKQQIKRNLIPSPSVNLSFFNSQDHSSAINFSSPLSSKSFGNRNNSSINCSRDLNSTFLNISPISSKRRKKRRKVDGNPFIQLEADVSEDSDSSEIEEFDGLDEYDSSFVDQENDDDGVTDSQQVRYLESLKDIPTNSGKVDKPLAPRTDNTSPLIGDMNYESDSFCVANDDVEFADIGVYTQAMNDARQEVLNENPSSSKRRRTRRHARSSPEYGHSSKVSLTKPLISKGRRRIIIHDSSDDD